MDKHDIERAFNFPINCEVYEGAIIPVMRAPRGFCYALAGDSYCAIAKREGVDEEELKRLNGNCVLYPTKKVWIP